MSQKRIAILFVGQLRTFEYCTSNILQTLVNYYNADVFCHTWLNSATDSEWKPIVSSNLTNEEITQKLSILHPKKIQIDEYIPEKYIHNKDLLQRFYNKQDEWYGKRGSRTIGSYYSLYACNELKRQYEQENNFTYDIVIKTRYDIELVTPLFHQSLIQSIDTNALTMNIESSACDVNDGIFFSSSSIMDSLCSLYLNIDEYFKKGIIIYCEIVFSHHIQHKQISINKIPIEYRIKRNSAEKFAIEVNLF